MIRKEPVIFAAALSTVIVTIASAFHVVLDGEVIETLATMLVPLIAAVLARTKVTPVG